VEPYRGEVMKCPACRDVVLRTFAGRLICDSCGGFFLTLKDFKTAVEDLCGVVELRFRDREPGERICPRCSQNLERCELTLDFTGIVIKGKDELDLCGTDGLWLDTGELEELLARAHKRLTLRPAR